MYKFLPFFILLALFALSLISNLIESRRRKKQLQETLQTSSETEIEFINFSIYRLMTDNIEEVRPGKYLHENVAIYKTPTNYIIKDFKNTNDAYKWLYQQP